jgi:hypothetical protein
MAWRPTQYLLEGELDNTMPGKVTGWMRFAGMKDKVTFDLKGDFHRDIRGAKIHLVGEGREDDPEAAGYFEGFAQHQWGKVGDITAGLPPQDYVAYLYVEWYSDENGRVCLEMDAQQVQVIGTPLPASQSQPLSRQEQARNMAKFLGSLSQAIGVPAVVGPGRPIVSDPAFSHWVIVEGQVVGEARAVQPAGSGLSFAYVRLFDMPEMAESGSIESVHLQPKSAVSAKAKEASS